MSSAPPPSPHCYTVELRFVGDDLDPDAITSELALPPSVMNSLRTPLPGRVRRPLWGYNGHDDPAFQAEWSSLEEGLNFLVGRLSAIRPNIVGLAGRYEGLWWCGHFQTSFDGGPTLSPQLLRLLSAFECSLFLDNYHVNDEEEPLPTA